MKTSKRLLIFCLLLVCFGFAQNKLTGKVTNFKNQPVSKAKIYLDSIDSNIETNKEGMFEVLLSNKVGTINVYSEKYGLLSSKFNDETSMNFIFLEPKTSKKDQKGSKFSIVYSKTDQKYQVVNSPSLNTLNDKNAAIYNTVYDMIRGKLAGVSVSSDNKITIQGVSSLRYIAEPLFVVDGIIVSSIDHIVPINVKSIHVLKGAEASIYGARGSSGVIVITTKQ